MKRFTLTLTALLLLPVSRAHALSETCTTILENPPVSSHYVQKVLERIDEGISHAEAAQTSSDFEIYMPSWSKSIASAFVESIDSQLRVTSPRESLPSMSACLHTDVLLLTCKMEEVRDKLHEQLNRGSFLAIFRLEAALGFLNERITHLLRGAHDGSYSDPTWGVQRAFDENEIADAKRPLCPFHSDYGPPSIDGFGCDESIMEPRTSIPSVEEELQGLKRVRSQLNDFRRAAEEFMEVQRQLEEIFNAGSNSSSAPLPPFENAPHKTVENCTEKRVGSFCSDERTRECEFDDDCKAGVCLTGSQKTGLQRELRGPFSLPKNHTEILAHFIRLRVAQGFSREQVNDLKIASEFPEENSEMRTQREKDNTLAQLLRRAARVFFRSWSKIQGRDETGVFAQATDAQLEVAASLSDLHTAISDLANLATKRTGVRSFVIRYAYFIRRMCIFRPCGKRLEQVMKILYQDECFPYTDGQFLNDSKGSPRWQKCAQAAEIELE